MGSPFPQFPLDIKNAMVQSRFHGERKPRNWAHLHCRPYTVLHETGFFVDPYCAVGFFAPNKDYICGFSIPVAFF